MKNWNWWGMFAHRVAIIALEDHVNVCIPCGMARTAGRAAGVCETGAQLIQKCRVTKAKL